MYTKEDISRAVEDPYQELAVGIIVQAIEDWRLLIMSPDKQTRFCNFSELRWFFNSQWCEFLLSGTEQSPKKILEILEGELYDSGFREPY